MTQKLAVEDDRPLYRQLAGILQSKIESCEYRAGEVIPSERKLCGIYEVSYVTVRQAVTELVKKGMLVRRQGKGTFVAPSGPGQLRNIGIILHSTLDASDPHAAAVIAGAGDACREAGYGIQLYPTGGAGLEDAFNGLLIHLIRTGRIKGVIPVGPLSRRDMAELDEAGTAVVNLVDYKEFDNHCVVIDCREATGRLARRLIEMGHRRIGLVIKEPERGESPHYMVANEMIEGMRSALAGAGLPFDRALFAEIPPGEERAAAGSEEMARLLAMSDGPTAIIAGSSIMLSAAIAAIAERGLTVPADISLCGIADEGFERFYTIGSVATGKIGRLAAERLLGLIDGGEYEERKIVVEAETREGQSIGPVQ